MGVIQIISNRPGAGKTCLIGAWLSRLAQRGKQISYYKPFTSAPGDDPDVTFVFHHLLAGEDHPEIPTSQPIAPGPTLSPALLQEFQARLSSLSTTADHVLVEGPEPDLAIQLAPARQSRIVLVVQYEKGLDPDALAGLAEPWGNNLAGVVINSFPVHRKQAVKQELVRALQAQNIPVLGAIPDDRTMLGVSVRQIADHLGGRWVQEPPNTDAYVDRFLIGGNIMDSGPSYFGRFPNQAVITRAERPDIQMASLMCDTKCLVLTGGAQPTEYVRVEASKKGVPLILVDGGTIGTAEALEGLLERANAYSMQKIQRFAQLVQEHLDTAATESLLA